MSITSHVIGFQLRPEFEPAVADSPNNYGNQVGPGMAIQGVQFTIGAPADYVTNEGFNLGSDEALNGMRFMYPQAPNDIIGLLVLEILQADITTPLPWLAVYRQQFHRLRLFKSSGGGAFTGTPHVLTGTVAAPTITTIDDAGTPDKALGIKTGALSTNGAASGVLGVQAPSLVMDSYTPAGSVAAGAATEITSADLAGGEVINAIGFFSMQTRNV